MPWNTLYNIIAKLYIQLVDKWSQSSSTTNQYIKMLVYCRYPIWKMFLCDERSTLETLDFIFHIGSTTTFIFQYVSEHCLRSTLRLFHKFYYFSITSFKNL